MQYFSMLGWTCRESKICLNKMTPHLHEKEIERERRECNRGFLAWNDKYA